MSTSAPNPGGANANLLAVMQSLTNAVNGLSNNVQTIQGGGLAAPASPSVDPFTYSGRTASSPSANAAVAALQQQVQAQQAALSEDSASESGGSASTPPNAIPTAPTSSQNQNNQNQQSQNQQSPASQDAIQALTWESLGSLGGPLGQFKQAQYTVGQYQNFASGVANSLFGQSEQENPDGSPMLDPETGEPVMGNNALASALGSSGVRSAGTIGLTAISSALDTGNTWAGIGQSLGYGHRIGLYGAATGQEGAYGTALSQGADIRTGVNDLYRQGMTLSAARGDVTAVTQAGFSDTGLAQGDNTNIASNLVAPMTQQGVSAEGATEWTEALRNAGTNVTALTSSLQNMSTAAQATKQTTDQFNSSLLSFAQSQVANGGTMGQGAQTGMDFTAATGMSPTILQTVQSNPVYQGLMMGENGVLPSDIGNLSPGAQLEGVKQMLSMYGGGLQGLNKNQYETHGGVRVVSSYGDQAEAAQIATMTGMTQSEVMRLMNETSGAHFQNVTSALNALGNSNGGIDGEGTGIYSILNRSKNWSGLSSKSREQATRYWNSSVGNNIHDMGLNESQIRKIQGTTNIDTRSSMLQKDLMGNQKNNPMNKITGNVTVKVDLSSAAKRMLKVTSGKGQVQMIGRAGGAAANSTINSPQGDAMVANDISQDQQAITLP